MTIEQLRDARKELTRQLADCEPGCFPGSREEKQESKAMRALGNFDEAHPEVYEAIKAERRADIAERYPNRNEN